MAYTRIDGELADFDRDHPWKKEYVSHIEDGIDDCESQCAELKDSLTQLAGGKYYTSLSSLINFANTLSQYQIALVYVNNDLMTELGGISGVAKGFITNSQNAENSFDYVLEETHGAYIYCGRVSDGDPLYCWRYDGTPISLTSASADNEK